MDRPHVGLRAAAHILSCCCAEQRAAHTSTLHKPAWSAPIAHAASGCCGASCVFDSKCAVGPRASLTEMATVTVLLCPEPAHALQSRNCVAVSFCQCCGTEGVVQGFSKVMMCTCMGSLDVHKVGLLGKGMLQPMPSRLKGMCWERCCALQVPHSAQASQISPGFFLLFAEPQAQSLLSALSSSVAVML
jgi:hypothetical protein